MHVLGFNLCAIYYVAVRIKTLPFFSLFCHKFALFHFFLWCINIRSLFSLLQYSCAQFFRIKRKEKSRQKENKRNVSYTNVVSCLNRWPRECTMICCCPHGRRKSCESKWSIFTLPMLSCVFPPQSSSFFFTLKKRCFVLSFSLLYWFAIFHIHYWQLSTILWKEKKKNSATHH